jgi:hypothetical protein
VGCSAIVQVAGWLFAQTHWTFLVAVAVAVAVVPLGLSSRAQAVVARLNASAARVVAWMEKSRIGLRRVQATAVDSAAPSTRPRAADLCRIASATPDDAAANTSGHGL